MYLNGNRAECVEFCFNALYFIGRGLVFSFSSDKDKGHLDLSLFVCSRIRFFYALFWIFCCPWIAGINAGPNNDESSSKSVDVHRPEASASRSRCGMSSRYTSGYNYPSVDLQVC